MTTYTCTTCGTVADKPGHLCNPCDDSKEDCSFCATPAVDTKHVCEGKLAELKVVCDGCGRLAVDEAQVCRPRAIKTG